MSSDPTPNFFTSYAQLIGLSAAVSGIISAVFNYFMNQRGFKKQKKVESLNEKITLYSYMIFQLDKMRFRWEALQKLPGSKPVDESTPEQYSIRSKEDRDLFEKITEKIQDKYSLFKQETLQEWINATALFHHPSALKSVPKVRDMLVNEYNNEIISEYEDLTGIKLEKKT